MQRRQRAGDLAVLLLAAAASGAELVPVPEGAPFRAGWQEAEVAAAPLEQPLKVRACAGKAPRYLALKLGSHADALISGVVDESRGTGTGYDVLYLDANNNNDLTDDPAIPLTRVVKEGGTLTPEIDPVEVAVKYADGAPRPLRVKVELHWSAGRPAVAGTWSAGGYVDQHLAGRLVIGSRTNVRVAVFDCAREPVRSNGCFNDYGADRIRIDLNGDAQFDPETEDFPVSRVLLIDGQLWQADLDSAGRQLSVRPYPLAAGSARVRLTYPGAPRLDGGMMEIAGDNGCGFSLALGTGAVFKLPPATYQIGRTRLVAADAKGKQWAAALSRGASFTVRASQTAEVTVGGPLTLGLDMQGELKPGEHICLMPRLAGPSGETYETISPEGTRMTPGVKIFDSEGITVSQGHMDYG